MEESMGLIFWFMRIVVLQVARQAKILLAKTRVQNIQLLILAGTDTCGMTVDHVTE